MSGFAVALSFTFILLKPRYKPPTSSVPEGTAPSSGFMGVTVGA